MANQLGFKEIDRKTGSKLPVAERIKHYQEIQLPLASQEIEKQASRCMDCGVPFCNNACPLGNSLPDLNDLVRRGNWEKALQILQATNNFPEFTGRLCPALCEASCNLSIHQKAVITKEIELSIVEKGFEKGWINPQTPVNKTGYKVAVVGSGPAGLAAAQQLIRAGHKVTVYERSAEIGGILALGIPDYKLEKTILKRRIDQLTAEGIHFVTSVSVGAGISIAALKEKYDAICLCCGSTVPRNLNVDGRHLRGIHFAMDFLTQQNQINAGLDINSGDLISAKDKHVVIIGGGDTGADCSGVAIRQGAVKVTQLELMPKPPLTRTSDMPWPEWPMTLTTNSAHEEGGERQWGVTTKYFIGEEDKVKEIVCNKVAWEKSDEGSRMVEVEEGTFMLKADLVLFAMGFLHPEHDGIVSQLNLKLSNRGNVETDRQSMTSQEGVFAAGDMRIGQSLVCKAIADGRKAAEQIHCYLLKDNR